jgi:yeast amino acid transporter
MIALSGVLGVTIYATMGQFLRTAGPAGLFIAIGYVGATAIFVMEGLGELLVQWPVANAMVRYVEVFVDEELAIVVGFVYWYGLMMASRCSSTL